MVVRLPDASALNNAGIKTYRTETGVREERQVALRLENVVPWGRSAREYRAMFALTPEDLRGRILDCGGGPSSFTAEMTRRGRQVVSCDPLYQFSAEEIRQRIDETYPRMVALNEANKENFRWEAYGSPAQQGQIRMRAMRRFLDDYPAGKEHGRYVVGELPALPFAARRFDLALCSHFLFTYSEQFSTAFHMESILEMARVAQQVRVFPLLTAFSGETSPHLAPVIEQLREQGFAVAVRQVDYEFQKGGNEMLQVSSAASMTAG
jgi:ubiquinone/menaquinone biosynthesis C-methylase UbiE